ncbi:FadR/GntR family transcriptional regulator [Acuticoccus sp. I52.16.1]|uniref:FadR/GntR family transcriptional regulator n=1 Tax=Acuticoccus sp. I52.16.1 TaxID=2928472 RepID=UPI001FD1529C|nr:FCD domain-containing protein [Acuticoccus sp. I52.16.1]UOM32586.1 FCD domain-containing protein [Acuticoccus sp. I52.16.1]
MSSLLARSPKLSSVVAGEIRASIIADGLQPGDNLPIEKEMIESFGVSRATIREALKELEVQGLIRMKTGPTGGPIVAGSGSQEALQAIQNFCYFEKVTIDDVYELRTLLEVRLVRSVVGHIDEESFARLQELADLSAVPARNEDARRRQREAEFEFHTAIAGCSPNRLLTMMIEVLAAILVHATARESSRHRMHSEWSCENARYHSDILDALRREDEEAAAALMEEHMAQAHGHLQLMYGQVSLEDIALGTNRGA